MNFLEGELKRDGGGLVFTQSGGSQVRLADTLAPRATGHARIPIVLGIRSTGLRPVFDGVDAVKLRVEQIDATDALHLFEPGEFGRRLV